jgi:anaerobic selenocysteine-containing dehydrogenase
VEPFDAQLVEHHTRIPFADVERVARLFATARRAGASAGTGPNMSGRGTLIEYLSLALLSVTGTWPRVGDLVRNPGVLLPPRRWVAAATEAVPVVDATTPARVRGLSSTSMGMPTAAAADEILLEGEGQVRALFVIGGNPVASWPDQTKVVAAMRSLELLVCIELNPTATTQFAHYVFAAKHALEVPGTTKLMEDAGASYPTGANWSVPYAMYSPAVVDPPPGSDVLDEAEIFSGLARRLGLDLKARGRAIVVGPTVTIDDVLAVETQGSRVPLTEVMRHRHGYREEGSPSRVVEEPGGDDGVRLDVGAVAMVAQLGDVATLSADVDRDYPFRLVSRRDLEVCNSANRNIAALTGDRTYNLVYVHSDDLIELGVRPGDVVEITSRRATIVAVVHSADDLRRGVVSCAHGWGDADGDASELWRHGSSTNRLIADDVDYDPWSGIPVMSAIPVRLRKVTAALKRAVLPSGRANGGDASNPGPRPSRGDR